MMEFNVNKLVFSSSATVYGQPQYLPVDENHPVGRIMLQLKMMFYNSDCQIDRAKRHCFFITTLVIQSPFLLPSFIRREEKRGKE